MTNPKRALPLFLAALLAGCFGAPYRQGAPVIETPPSPRPAPVATPQPPPPPVANEEVQIAAYQPPVQIRPEPVNTSAVTGLLEKADQQQQAGDMIGAAANLERALRIEPRNAHLWNRLAHVRLSQQQFAQAQDLASKSNSLAGADRWLHQNNWQLIAEARRMSGDLSGARAAEQKAADLR